MNPLFSLKIMIFLKFMKFSIIREPQPIEFPKSRNFHPRKGFFFYYYKNHEIFTLELVFQKTHGICPHDNDFPKPMEFSLGKHLSKKSCNFLEKFFFSLEKYFFFLKLMGFRKQVKFEPIFRLNY